MIRNEEQNNKSEQRVFESVLVQISIGGELCIQTVARARAKLGERACTHQNIHIHPDSSRLQLLSVHIRSFPFSCVCPSTRQLISSPFSLVTSIALPQCASKSASESRAEPSTYRDSTTSTSPTHGHPIRLVQHDQQAASAGQQLECRQLSFPYPQPRLWQAL